MSEIENEIVENDPFEGMSDEEVAELLEVFFDDISEKTEDLSSLILELEENPGSKETVNSIFQIYHSLKGTIGTFGFLSVGELMHKLEYLIEDVREDKLSVTSDLIDLLLLTLDIFNKIVVKIRSRRPTGSEELQINTLIDQFWKLSPETVLEIPEAPPQKEVVERLKEEAVSYIKLKSAKLDKLVDLSSDLLLRKRNDIVLIKKLKSFLKDFRLTGSRLNAVVESMREKPDNLSTEKISQELNAACSSLETFLREIITENEELSENSAKMLDELQNEVLQVRMVEVSEYFQQLKRMVRDLVLQEDKKVRLQLSGFETEIDRNIIDEIKDPLMHMVRNAIDHGIESQAERIAEGKPEEAVLRISAFPTGNEVTIKLEDDGRGIDVESLKKTALEKGLYSEEELGVMSEPELLNIIFSPGFSTKGEVSQVSGRGVGMDVVKTNVERLRGIISVETEKGKGTRFTLKLPTTQSAFPAVLLRAGEFYFYSHIIAVDRILRIPPGGNRPLREVGSIELDGAQIPFIYLGKFFNIKRETGPLSGTYIIILQSGEQQLAIEIDDCLDRHDIVLKPSPDIAGNVASVAGISVLPDGKIAWVVEPFALVSEYQELKTDSGEVWKIDPDLFESFDLPYFHMGREAIGSPGIELKQYLQFKSKGKTYGIPVESIVSVYNLYDPNLVDNLKHMYDSVLTVRDDEAFIMHREEMKNPLKWDQWQLKGAAVVLQLGEEIGIMIPESLGIIEYLDQKSLDLVNKSGTYKQSVPDIVRIH